MKGHYGVDDVLCFAGKEEKMRLLFQLRASVMGFSTVVGLEILFSEFCMYSTLTLKWSL